VYKGLNSAGAQFGPSPNTETMPEPGEVDNVSRPTMTVYSPEGKNTGAAVVVFPGGAISSWRSISKARRSVTG
jgi:hypothetical protein